MQAISHRSEGELEAALETIRAAPRDVGVVEMIVRRPAHGEREVLDEGTLDLSLGLVGDNWHLRPARSRTDGSPDPERQLTLMSARAIAAVAVERARWPLAGDQLFVDLDLGLANLPPGTRLGVGPGAVLEVSAAPHTGCAKFTERFGSAAIRWANTPEGRALNLRGINAKVVTGGVVRRGDIIRKTVQRHAPAPGSGRRPARRSRRKRARGSTFLTDAVTGVSTSYRSGAFQEASNSQLSVFNYNSENGGR